MSDGEELTLRDRVVLLLENLVMQGFDIQDASTWTEMGLDSLDKIEMMMDMEDEFSISIPDAGHGISRQCRGSHRLPRAGYRQESITMTKIQYIHGDLLASTEAVIAHGCNAQGVMRSGVAKAIREKYPQAYVDYYNAYYAGDYYLRLGDVIETRTPDRTILNIISQQFYGRDPSVVYVSYDAIGRAIKRINELGYHQGRVSYDWSRPCQRKLEHHLIYHRIVRGL
jgi:hypothetical protein